MVNSFLASRSWAKNREEIIRGVGLWSFGLHGRAGRRYRRLVLRDGASLELLGVMQMSAGPRGGMRRPYGGAAGIHSAPLCRNLKMGRVEPDVSAQPIKSRTRVSSIVCAPDGFEVHSKHKAVTWVKLINELMNMHMRMKRPIPVDAKSWKLRKELLSDFPEASIPSSGPGGRGSGVSVGSPMWAAMCYATPLPVKLSVRSVERERSTSSLAPAAG
ncbi:hypothetical protein EYF80_037981 [Liparis tanakae]|uniref:Uncharacterized protein n=1 Tax=Liparis tanakae TaxID=230148 RepID=A0A4Z2GFY6_9TELE|nr:hypothetical protein EYF80_037981 [Liparis tanakae]